MHGRSYMLMQVSPVILALTLLLLLLIIEKRKSLITSGQRGEGQLQDAHNPSLFCLRLTLKSRWPFFSSSVLLTAMAEEHLKK